MLGLADGPGAIGGSSAESSNELEGAIPIAGAPKAPDPAAPLPDATGVAVGVVVMLAPVLPKPSPLPGGVAPGAIRGASKFALSASFDDEPQPTANPLASSSMQSTRVHALVISSSHAAGRIRASPGPGCNRCASV
jgi:hypothetical protein